MSVGFEKIEFVLRDGDVLPLRVCGMYRFVSGSAIQNGQIWQTKPH